MTGRSVIWSAIYAGVIVAWLLGNGLLHIANSIESGEPLAGNDE